MLGAVGEGDYVGVIVGGESGGAGGSRRRGVCGEVHGGGIALEEGFSGGLAAHC